MQLGKVVSQTWEICMASKDQKKFNFQQYNLQKIIHETGCRWSSLENCWWQAAVGTAPLQVKHLWFFCVYLFGVDWNQLQI